MISNEFSARRPGQTVADVGEFGLIAQLRTVLPSPADAVVANGDDAAVVPAPDGRVVATTDLLVEGRHFRRDWSGPVDIGAKAAAQNLADVAAMGAVPTALLLGLAVPAETRVDWLLSVCAGFAAECERAGAAVAGGDVTGADTVVLAVTALGDLAGRAPVTRTGARPGDVVALSGPVGWSAAGLALLAAGERDDPLIAVHRRPQPDYAAGPVAAAAGATAMIDISDGLVADLGHVAAASGVCIDISLASLPGTAALTAAAARLRADWRTWALGGGEDHALAAAFPPEASVPPSWTVVAGVYEGNGVRVGGSVWHGRGGWDHFAL